MKKTFEVNMVPVPKGRPRLALHGHVYTPHKTVVAEREVQMSMRRLWTLPALSCGLSVDIAFYLPIPKSLQKGKNAKNEGSPHVFRPDGDNLEKLVWDALNGIVWKDDGQIWRHSAIKLYSNRPRIEITIEYASNE